MADIDRWIEENVPDLTGKVAIVTGANSGLGLEASRVLARRGAHVAMAVRSETRGSAAAGEIRSGAPEVSLAVTPLDLADLASVRTFAEGFLAAHDRLDMLVNNAGVMGIPYGKTRDGFEMQFGTNYLGHFALTGLLMPLILKTPGARVVTVSSSMHTFGRIRFDDLNGERSYSKWGAYAQSKLADLLFAYELQRRLDAAGPSPVPPARAAWPGRDGLAVLGRGCSVISVAAHPGYAATNLQMVGPQMEGSRIAIRFIPVGSRLFAQSAAMGALPEIYAATSPDVRGGDYIGPGGFMEQRGFPVRVKSSARSHDAAAARRLWTVSEQLTGVSYPFE